MGKSARSALEARTERKRGKPTRKQLRFAAPPNLADTMTEWRKDSEFSGTIKRATAERLLLRLERIEAGEPGRQGTAWALERIYPHRFARPEVMNQIAVVQAGKAPERVIVLPSADFDAFKGREGYRQRANGDLERLEGSLFYVIVRQQSNPSLT